LLVENASTSKQPVSGEEYKTDASLLPCAKPTTNLQRFPVADLKKQSLTQNLRR
jgi:hypothetical protein